MAKVACIVPTHLNENQKYLDICLDSIYSQDVDKEVLVYSTCEKEPQLKHKVNKLIHEPGLSTFSKKVNRGVKETDSEIVAIISDDVVLSKNSLNVACNAVGESMILGPVSNTENGNRMFFNLKVGDIRLPRYMDYEYMGERVKELVNYQHIASPIYFEWPNMCFYCVVMPRKIWDLVGGLDEQFTDGYEDIDFCRSAFVKTKIRPYILSSFYVTHFGGKTTEKTLTKEITAQNNIKFAAKWANAEVAWY